MAMNVVRLLAAVALLVPLSVNAQITIGVNLSTTGPGAALGIQTNNAVRLWPATLGGQPARYVILDDGTDVSRSVKKYTQADLGRQGGRYCGTEYDGGGLGDLGRVG